MSTIELKPTVQDTAQSRPDFDATRTAELSRVEATQLVSRDHVARQLVRERVVDQRQEAQLYQSEWSPSESQRSASGRHSSFASTASSRVNEARDQLTQFLAQKNVKRQRGSIEERELKRLTELYGEATESLLHLRLVRRGAKESSLLECSQDEFAQLVERPKEGTKRVSTLDLGGSEASEADVVDLNSVPQIIGRNPNIDQPASLSRTVTVHRDEPTIAKVTPENSRAALQALLADIAQITPMNRRR